MIPGSMPLLLQGLLIGVALIYLGEGWSKWGRRLLLAILVAYGLMSIPLVSDALRAGLNQGYSLLTSKDEAKDATAIVVLSGGSQTYRTDIGEINSMSRSTAFRALEALRVYSLLDNPLVIVSGGVGDSRITLTPESKALADSLIDAGVPEERILREAASRNTYEHALNLKPLLATRNIETFVLVTSPTHMWRAHSTFNAHGLKPIPSVAATQSTGHVRNNRLIPSVFALANTRDYFREYLALLVYWYRGWLTQMG